MQRLTHLLPGEARCVPPACRQRGRCAFGCAPYQDGREVADYSSAMGWRDGECPRFVDVDKRRDAPAAAPVVHEALKGLS